MTIDKVSDVLAFVAKEAEFTKSILFAETDVPEINADERSAIASVSKHVEASYIALLNQCRSDMFERADDTFKKTMGANWNRDQSIWERARVELPLVIASSYVAVAYWWIDEEPSAKPGVLSLVGELSTQVRKRDVLLKIAEKHEKDVFIFNHNVRTLASPLVEGVVFADLARQINDRLWPLAIALRAALTTRVIHEGIGPIADYTTMTGTRGRNNPQIG